MPALRVEPLPWVGVRAMLPRLRTDGMAQHAGLGRWWCVRVRGHVAGVLHVVTRGRSSLLDDVWVAPRHRRRGLGRALVRRAQRGRASLWLIADGSEAPYYEALGFRRARALPAWIASHYRVVGLWPRDAQDGHRHVAMRWRR